jgi:hypothetical protein
MFYLCRFLIITNPEIKMINPKTISIDKSTMIQSPIGVTQP